MFDRWGEIRGVGAELLIALAEPFRVAASEELVPEHYPFIKTRDLMRRVDCDSEEAFRRRVERCRKAIARLASDAGVAPPSTDAVIESNQWHGYRLNPDRVRIVALSELSPRN